MEIQGTHAIGISAPILQTPAPLQNGPVTPPLGGMQNAVLLQPALGQDSITHGAPTGTAFKNASVPDSAVADGVEASLNNVVTLAVGAAPQAGNVDTPGQQLERFLSAPSAASNPLTQWLVSTTSQSGNQEQTDNATQSTAVLQLGEGPTLVTQQVATQTMETQEAVRSPEVTTQSALSTLQKGQSPAASAAASASVPDSAVPDVAKASPSLAVGVASSPSAVEAGTSPLAAENDSRASSAAPNTDTPGQRLAGLLSTPSAESNPLSQWQVSTTSGGVSQEAVRSPEVMKQSALSTGQKGRSPADIVAAAAAASVRQEISKGGNDIGQERRYLPFMESNAKRETEAIRNGEILERLIDPQDEAEAVEEPNDPFQNSTFSPLARMGREQPFASVASVAKEAVDAETVAGANRAGDPLKGNNQNTWRTTAAPEQDVPFVPAQVQNPTLAPAIVRSVSAASMKGGSSPLADAVSGSPGFKAAQMAFQGVLSFEESTDERIPPAVSEQGLGAGQQGLPQGKSMLESAAELMAFINQPQRPQDIGGPYYGAEPGFGLRGEARKRRGASEDPHDQQRRERRNQVWAALAESRAQREREEKAKREAEAAEKKVQRKKPKGGAPPRRARLPKAW